MKRFLVIFSSALLAIIRMPLAAQTHASVSVDNRVYAIIEHAQMRGLCPPLPTIKPYPENVVADAINEILAASDAAEKRLLSKTEEQILRDALEQFQRKHGFDVLRGGYYFEGKGKIRTTFDAALKIDSFVSGGIYNNRSDNQWGMWLTPTVSLRGDLSKYLSYDFNLFGNMSRAVLKPLGEYEIGRWWYTQDVDGTGARNIKSFANKAFLPFSYHKQWDGSIWHLTDLSASGLEGWCDNLGVGFGILSEIDLSAFNDRVFLRFGRIKREWAAMDEGASLVLNKHARPFIAFEFAATPVRWFTLSSLTGVLEYPNSKYMVGEAYNSKKDYTYYSNDMFFQNAYSAAMFELNFKYVHFDFGTTAVWPKRFDLGYFHPLMNKVFYQNNVGDNDNLALFTNLKLSYPGIGYVWASFFLDEFVGLNKTTGLFGDFIHATRNMYATQAGMKANFPWLPFTTVSLRYTKIEPFCYTHQGINYTWYTHYISEAYMNSGESLGYYLPPNSDEILVRFDSLFFPRVSAHLEYQFIRHGAEHGSQAVKGSSLYSELQPNDRDSLRKYFLHDGAYQWFHIVKFGADWNLKQFKVPLTVYANIGFVYSYYTVIDGTPNDNQKHSYHRANTSEYPTEFGTIISGGVKVWF
ncbi:MAG: hypothetical protein J6I73_04375 [Treponema sp.]|nr:hypothetical protein [Treponema sp.]